MNSNDRILSLLGLSLRGGNLAVGEEPVDAAARAKDARLLLLAADSADNTRRRCEHMALAGSCLWVRLPCTKEQMGRALGRNSVALAAVTDIGLASALAKLLAELDVAQYGDTAARMAEKARRAAERKAEQAAHEKNLRKGRRKPPEPAPRPPEPEAPRRPEAPGRAPSHRRPAGERPPDRRSAQNRSPGRKARDGQTPDRRPYDRRGSEGQAGRQIHGRRSAEQRTPGGAAGRGDAPASKRYSRPSRDKRPKPKGQARPYANSRPVKKGKGSFRKKEG